MTPPDPPLWQEGYGQATTAQRLHRLGGLLAQGLESRLRSFQSALEAVAWPEGERLAQPEERLSGLLTATARQGDAAQPYERLVSRGLAPLAPTTLAPGSYDLRLGLGSQSQDIRLQVAAGDTNRDVLQRLRQAVADSPLAVEAAVRTQSAPGQHGPGLGVGDMLTLAVNDARSPATPTLEDVRGHLAAWLNLSAAPRSNEPSEPGATRMAGRQPWSPTSFVSKGFDPNQATTLPAGTYTVDWGLGARSGQVAVPVVAGQSWRQVMDTLANRLSSAQSDVSASVGEVERPWYDPRVVDMVARQMAELRVTAAHPKVGERLRLSEDVTTAPDGATGLLARLGLTATAQPGSDGQLDTAGETLTRAPGRFDLDQGRLAVDLRAGFQPPGSVAVSDAVSGLWRSLQHVAAGYNEVQGFLRRDQDLWEPGLAQRWSRPLADRQGALATAGWQLRGDGSLALDEDLGNRSLRLERNGLRSALVGEDGLLPAWRQATRLALEQGGTSLLAPEPALAGLDRRLLAAQHNQFRALLLDLLG